MKTSDELQEEMIKATNGLNIKLIPSPFDVQPIAQVDWHLYSIV